MHLKINKPRVKSRQTLLNNQFLTVYQDQLVLGHQTHDYFWTKVANGVSVVALNDSRQICLITVYRHASNTFALSLPSGGIDISETPLAAAKRELAEEAGVTASTFKKLGVFHPSPGSIRQKCHYYLATGLKPTTASPQSLELIQIHWETINRVKDMINNGQITDAWAVIPLLTAFPLLP